jgi:hypothetical protein
MSMFPTDFALPKKANLGIAWFLWHQGRPVDRIPPYRHLVPADFALKSDDRKRLSDWKKMMTMLGQQLGAIYDAAAFQNGTTEFSCKPLSF